MTTTPDPRDQYATPKDAMDALESELEDLGDYTDPLDIYTAISITADYMDIDLIAALTCIAAEPDISDEMEKRINALSRSEVRLILDLIETSQSNPSSAIPALLKIAVIDDMLGSF